MGIVMAAAFPVLPGQSDRVKGFGKEIDEHREEWERLNREATFTHYSVHLQESPQGDLAIHVFEVEDPTKVRTGFTDSPYDNWWQGYLRDVHGLDLRRLPEVPPPPPVVFSWDA